jgi:hypothetical protein
MSKYKTKFCKFYQDELEKCEYEIFCPCAHSEHEIKAELSGHLKNDADYYMFYYKTECCPYALKAH